MKYVVIYETKKEYLNYILENEKMHDDIYLIIKNDKVNYTKNNNSIFFDLENINNHTWLKIKEYVDNFFHKNNLEKKSNNTI